MSATICPLRFPSTGSVGADAPSDGGDDLGTSDHGTLDSKCDELLNIDSNPPVNDKVNEDIVKFVLENASTNEENRVVVPAIWNEKNLDKLPKNYKLASNVLNSTRKKLVSDAEKLSQYDSVISQQISEGILERVDLEDAMESDQTSFLAHHAVFREEATTTKCRVVLMSNVCEKGKDNLNHNQVSLPGPQLNTKLSTTLTLYRFNKFLMIYDLKQAFLQLCLRPEDTKKLHILWFENAMQNSFSQAVYKFSRVPFGLRFSPTLLMISLYLILILHAFICSSLEVHIRNMLFCLAYMDNLAFSSNDEAEMIQAYELSNTIFNSFKFKLQKFATNSTVLESHDQAFDSEENSNLFGVTWCRTYDVLATNKFYLDPNANTRRKVLQALNKNLDILGFMLPILNRAKLFLHSVNMDKRFGWDTILDKSYLKQWKNIANQINNGANISIPRYLGGYNDSYYVLVYTDSSREFYGCVAYLQPVDTNAQNFAFAKNKLISKKNRNTIPVLELLSIEFGLKSTCEFIAGLREAFCPIDIRGIKLFSDSTISLNWVKAKMVYFSKIEKKGSVINNSLDRISKFMEMCPVQFGHVDGHKNPADHVTRCVSSRVLQKSNFHSGPKPLGLETGLDLIQPVLVMPPFTPRACNKIDIETWEPVFPTDKISSFDKLVKISRCVIKFINKLKVRINLKNDRKYELKDPVSGLFRETQLNYFKDVFTYLRNPTSHPCPNLVSQLNVFFR